MGIKKDFFYIILLSFISIINSLVEIPLQSIEIEGVSKYGEYKIAEPAKNLNGDYGQKIFIDQGNSILTTNRLYVTTVKVGSQNQIFNLLLDTGSFILWVPKKNGAHKYQKEHYYDPTVSTTSVKTNLPMNIKYGSGSCSGFFFRDKLNYLKNRQFQMLFGVSFKSDFGVVGADGIIGLGHIYDNEQLSFIHMLKKGKVTESLLFSLKFGSDPVHTKVGKLIIGKHEDFSKKNVVTAPLITGLKHWACKINSFSIQNPLGIVNSKRSYGIIFDTGTNSILLPLQYYQDLTNNIKKLNCYFKDSSGKQQYQLACTNINNLPDFRFEINGSILIVPKIYTFYRGKDNIYYSKVIFSEREIYIIGTPFFLAFHTLFDKTNEKLHFYPENDSFLLKKTN